MVDQRKSGDCRPAFEIICVNFKTENTRLKISRQPLKALSQNTLLVLEKSNGK